MKLTKENGVSWEAWLAELERQHLKFGMPCNADECWREYYDDDYTPGEAWAEDMSYAD